MSNYNAYIPTGYPTYQTPYYAPQYQTPMQIVTPPQVQTQASTPMQQSAPPQTQPQNAPSTIIWVSGERAALEYPVMANGAVALWDQNAPVIYLKQADASGKPSTKIFDLVERVEQSQNAPAASQIDLSGFAEKSDISAIYGVVDGIKREIEAMKDELANMAASAVKRAVGVKPKKEVENNE